MPGTKEEKTIRTFIAVDISSETRRNLANLQDKLREAGGSVKWVRPESIHLTLRFLGNIDPARVALVERALKKTADMCKPCEVELKGLGGFPDLKRPRVIWAGIDTGADELTRMAECLEQELKQTGFGSADKPFKPHITLGRVKSLQGIQPLLRMVEKTGSQEIGRFKAGAVRLYQSRLDPRGAVYTVLLEQNLRSGALEE